MIDVEKKANHRANVIRVSDILPHPDPETTNLELIHIDGYQVVVRKGEFKVGDLAIYVQPDSVVPSTEPFRFIWNDHVGLDGTVPEKRRRITVRKFRKEWSEGLLLPLSDFTSEEFLKSVGEGVDVSYVLGITHYDPDTQPVNTQANQANAPKRKLKYPKTFKGWMKFIWYHLVGRPQEALTSVPFVIPTYDVEAYKNYKYAFNDFDPNDKVVVTEKIHGSNARYLFLGGTMYAGSKNQWKAPGNNVWHKALEQNAWIEDWCRSNEGYALFGEVVPTQGKFDYGCKPGEVRFFAFDIYSPDGKWIDDDEKFQYGSLVEQAPLLYYGPFDQEKIMKLVDGPSWVPGANHIREGFVIKSAKEKHVRGLGRLQVKVVSNTFLEKDSK